MAQWRNGNGTLTVTDAREGQGPRAPEAPEAPEAPAIPLRIAATYRTRSRGLLGQDGIDGALLITPCGSVHTFGMRFTIDVAYVDRKFNVIAVRTMKPGRLGLPRLRARHVIESEAGAMEAWGLRPGTRVSIVQEETDRVR
ncbi:DUF192 domain-containing protein [Streptomyces sp. NPDC002164]|uniref:DUF192 domain-containing protein n=1 Tax=Streptomyces sp. NPDC002164 TaxID=3364633 RepID=UPI0036A4ACBD